MLVSSGNRWKTLKNRGTCVSEMYKIKLTVNKRKLSQNITLLLQIGGTLLLVFQMLIKGLLIFVLFLRIGNSDSKKQSFFIIFLGWYFGSSMIGIFPSWNILWKMSGFIWQAALHVVYDVPLHTEHTVSKLTADTFIEVILKLVLTLFESILLLLM